MPYIRTRSGELLEIDDDQAAQATAAGRTIYATEREASAPAPQVGAWSKVAPGNSVFPIPRGEGGPSVMEVLFPRAQASTRAGRGALAGNVETLKDVVTSPFRAAAGLGSYIGTLGSEARNGGLESPQAFANAKEVARQQALRDVAAPGADIEYPGWASGFVAPAQDPVAAAMALLPMGRLAGIPARGLGALALRGGAPGRIAGVAADALASPVGQGAAIGATGAGLGLGMGAMDRAVEGQPVTAITPEEAQRAALMTVLGGVTGGAVSTAANAAGRVAPWLEQKAGGMIRKAIKPNNNAQEALEESLVEGRILPNIVSNWMFTPGQIARKFAREYGARNAPIGPALAEADKAGPIYSSASALEAAQNRIATEIEKKNSFLNEQQEAAINNYMRSALQNRVPRAAGPYLPGSVEEAPVTASQAYNSKKTMQRWSHNREEPDPMTPTAGRVMAAKAASRNFNEQLAETAPDVKALDAELAPYSHALNAMETAAGPRSNRYIMAPAFWFGAGHISAGRQAWNLAQALRVGSQIRPAAPASTAVYLAQALQRQGNTPQE